MLLEPLAWMAEELGYPTFTQWESGELELNDAARDLLGAECRDLSEALDRLFESGAPDEVREAIESARRGTPGTIRIEGIPVVFSSTAREGGVRVILPYDPEERERLERRAAAGEMAAGVAHEVANALSSVIGWCTLAKQDPEAAPADLALDRAAQGADVAREAARQLMHLGRSRRSERAITVNVGRTLEEVAALLRPVAVEADVAVRVQVEEDLFVRARRSDLISIVWNLAHNGLRALSRKGHLTLEASSDDGTIEIHVSDDGPGMSAEVARRATQRRFTTHPEGFGLGLPLVVRTIDQLGGTLELDTAPGEGCRFRVALPGAPPPSRKDTATTLKPSGMRGRVQADGQRVLVVEDDQGVRELITTMLEIQGFSVVAVESAAEALAVGQGCQLALIDFHLEDERGDALLADLRKNGFEGAVTIMSGGDPPKAIVEGGTPDRWLRKPFDPADLLAHLLELRGLLHAAR